MAQPQSWKNIPAKQEGLPRKNPEGDHADAQLGTGVRSHRSRPQVSSHGQYLDTRVPPWETAGSWRSPGGAVCASRRNGPGMLDVTPTTKPKRLKLPYRRVNKLKDKAEEIVKSFQPLDTTLKYAPRPTGWTDEQVVEESHKGRHFEISTMPRGQLRIVNGNDLKDWEKVGLARAQAEALRAANDDKRRLGTVHEALHSHPTGRYRQPSNVNRGASVRRLPCTKSKAISRGRNLQPSPRRSELQQVTYSRQFAPPSRPSQADRLGADGQQKREANDFMRHDDLHRKLSKMYRLFPDTDTGPEASLDSGEMVNLIDDKVKELVAKMELITKISEHNERMLGVYERRKQKLEAENLLLVAKIAEMKNCGRRQSRVVRRRDFYVIGLPQEPSKVWEPRERSSSDDSWLDTDEDEMLIGAECRAGSSESCAEKTQLRSALEEMRELDLLTFH